MSKVRLSPKALADIDEITDYGIEKFGARATASYIRGIHDLIAKLAGYPGMGTGIASLHKQRRRHPFRRHVVFYEFHATGIVVLRIYPMPRLRKSNELPD